MSEMSSEDLYKQKEPKDVESIFTEDELDSIFEAYFAVTGDRNLDNVTSLMKQAAYIRLMGNYLEGVLEGRLGLSLDKGRISFWEPMYVNRGQTKGMDG